MNKTRIVLIIVLILLTVAGIVLGIFTFLLPKKAGITVETNPASTVFIDGEEMGRTPFRDTLNQGEVTLRLVPDSFGTPLMPYETKVDLVPGVETVVRRVFDGSEEFSQGEIISFNKTYKNETGVLVVSDPEGAQVVIDRQVKGFAPYTTTSISADEHTISVEAKGYLSRAISVKTELGYKLVIAVKLSKDPNFGNDKVEEEATETKTVPMVEILDTPTGFLRVRVEDATSSDEVGQVEPGKSYELLEENDDGSWYKIGFDEGKSGWVSSQYAEKVETATGSGKIQG